MTLGWSSCSYPLDAADLVAVPDYDGPALPSSSLPGDEVILYIARGCPDRLLRGRERVLAAGGGTVSVRLVFEPTIARWNLPFVMIRALRDRRRYKSTGIYHIAPEAVRQMRIERTVRTSDNLHSRQHEDRVAALRKLERSLRENGYDDKRPINVMLCRSRGEDSLRQGHHRVSACIACGIPRMAVRFTAAAYSPRLWRFIGRVPVRFDVLKGSIESATGRSVSRIIPLGDQPVPRQVIVVPETGGRYVMSLVEDKSVTLGIARALIVPVLVLGALALDIAVLKTACGKHSFVVWSQCALAFFASGVMAYAAVREPRGRAGYIAMASLFTAMATYDLLRDALDVGTKTIGIVASVAAVACAGACFLADGRRFKTGLRRIASSGGFPALPFGFFFVWVFSRIMSSRAVWGSLDLTARDFFFIRHIIEESSEFFGYAIIASWAAAFFLERRAYRGRR